MILKQLKLLVCVRATKKIFSAVLRMISNFRKNEILADARMKSANADEIFGFASDEIKSTHSPSRRISPNEVGFHRGRRFHPPARVDLVEKSTDKVDAFFWLGNRDSNPNKQSQSLSCYRYTIPQYSVVPFSTALSIISFFCPLSSSFLNIFYFF